MHFIVFCSLMHPCEVVTVLCNTCPMNTRGVRRFILTTLPPKDVIAFAFGLMNGGLCLGQSIPLPLH